MHQTFEPLFVDYCTYFNGNQDYFECHEVLEELWKEKAPRNKEHVLVGLIQVATAMYHWRRDNFKGAQKSMTSALTILQGQLQAPYITYLNKEQLIANCEQSLKLIHSNEPFQAFKLSLNDSTLHALVEQAITKLPKTDSHFLLHKHKLRDRREVIAARANRLAAKQQKGS